MKINEIFYSLQGEGFFTGTPAIFIRLSGCNLACPFCDTRHQTFTTLSAAEVLQQIAKYPATHVVITGGEPALQLTDEFVEQLHQAGYFVQVETNGTLPLPANLDWITCSPKQSPITPSAENLSSILPHIEEIKLLFMNDATDRRIPAYAAVPARYHYLQPCDHSIEEPDPGMLAEANSSTLSACIDYIKSNPIWRLSLQTHKLINIR